MGCNNANPRKCANCLCGSPQKDGVDIDTSLWYNQTKAQKKAQARKNAIGHKAYHNGRLIPWPGPRTGPT